MNSTVRNHSYLLLVLFLLLAGCTNSPAATKSDANRIPVRVSVTHSSGQLSVVVSNKSGKALQYAWPVFMHSWTIEPTVCPLPEDAEYHIFSLTAHSSVSIKFDQAPVGEYIGLWIKPNFKNDINGMRWQIVWSEQVVK